MLYLLTEMFTLIRISDTRVFRHSQMDGMFRSQCMCVCTLSYIHFFLLVESLINLRVGFRCQIFEVEPIKKLVGVRVPVPLYCVQGMLALLII